MRGRWDGGAVKAAGAGGSHLLIRLAGASATRWRTSPATLSLPLYLTPLDQKGCGTSQRRYERALARGVRGWVSQEKTLAAGVLAVQGGENDVEIEREEAEGRDCGVQGISNSEPGEDGQKHHDRQAAGREQKD